MSTELKPCPFCGTLDIDPEGWTSNDGRSGPTCMSCGASAESVKLWNTRTNQKKEPHRLEMIYVDGSLNVRYYMIIKRVKDYGDFENVLYWTGPMIDTFSKQQHDAWATTIKNEAENYLEHMIWMHIIS